MPSGTFFLSKVANDPIITGHCLIRSAGMEIFAKLTGMQYQAISFDSVRSSLSRQEETLALHSDAAPRDKWVSKTRAGTK